MSARLKEGQKNAADLEARFAPLIKAVLTTEQFRQLPPLFAVLLDEYRVRAALVQQF